MALQTGHYPARILIVGPFTYQLTHFSLMLFTSFARHKALVRKPLWFLRDRAETFPLGIVPTTNHTPLSVTTWVTSMRRDLRVTVTIPAGNRAIGRIVEQRAS